MKKLIAIFSGTIVLLVGLIFIIEIHEKSNERISKSYSPVIVGKERLVSEYSDKSKDLLFLGQDMADAREALSKEKIQVNSILEFEDESKDNYGESVIGLGDTNQILLSYSNEGKCYAIIVYGYDLASGIKIGDYLLLSSFKLDNNFSKIQDTDTMTTYVSSLNGMDIHLTYHDVGSIGKRLYGWGVYDTDS